MPCKRLRCGSDFEARLPFSTDCASTVSVSVSSLAKLFTCDIIGFYECAYFCVHTFFLHKPSTRGTYLRFPA
jgi:hypothetical protein